jgi:hypothetical protein
MIKKLLPVILGLLSIAFIFAVLFALHYPALSFRR